MGQFCLTWQAKNNLHEHVPCEVAVTCVDELVAPQTPCLVSQIMAATLEWPNGLHPPRLGSRHRQICTDALAVVISPDTVRIVQKACRLHNAREQQKGGKVRPVVVAHVDGDAMARDAPEEVRSRGIGRHSERDVAIGFLVRHVRSIAVLEVISFTFPVIADDPGAQVHVFIVHFARHFDHMTFIVEFGNNLERLIIGHLYLDAIVEPRWRMAMVVV